MPRLERLPGDRDPRAHQEQLMVQGDTIPSQLKGYARPQFVCWRYVYQKEGQRPLKVPVNPRNLHNAGVKWPNTWGTFEQAYTSYLRHRSNGIAGIGFVLTPDDPFVAVDLDNCVSQEGIAEPAVEVIQTLQSYTETSPSGHGLRILVGSPDYQENHKSKTVEIYSHARFATVTGARVAGSPENLNTVDPSVLRSLLPPPSPTPSPTPHEVKHFVGTDAQLWELIFRHDKFGAQHQERFNGNLAVDQDHSLTVIRLLNTLARWTDGDAARMRQMMLMSPLANPKWFTKRGSGDWLEHQIRNAIQYVQKGK